MTTQRPERSATSSNVNEIKPKRVRGGRKLRAKERPIGESALARDWVGLVDAVASDVARREGFEYATLGQIVTFEFQPGHVEGRVQGRVRKPYTVRLEIDGFSDAEWDELLASLAREARTVAALLESQVSDHVLAQLREINRPLLPEGESVLRFSCTCDDCDPKSPQGACKHVIALGYVIAEDLDASPMNAFTLRGVPAPTFLDRLRMRRMLDIGGGTARALQSIEMPATESEEAGPPESDRGDDFWDSGPGLHEVTEDLIKPDMPAHALLRRLGPSPFVEESRFPMAGLLATCYDVIADAATRDQFGESHDEEDAGESEGRTSVNDS